MVTAATKFFTFLSPTRITGPIFEKELRVSSRHKRTYFLRFLFIIAITTFMAIVWMNEVDRDIFTRFGGPVFGGNQSFLATQAQMAQIGKFIIMCVALFLFYSMPSLAIILLSTSISSEIHAKTIGVLVSTPITSFQIVMGKMLSKLYQLILLMAISIPILSMVRVFGGVQWNYIIATSCITLCITILAGSLSLFLSIYIKKPFIVIPLAAGLILLSIFLVTWIMMWIQEGSSFYRYNSFNRINIFTVFHCLSPYHLINTLTKGMFYARRIPFRSFTWPLHCCISLMFSTLILLIASLKVRKVALMQITGQLSPLKRWLNTESKNIVLIPANPKKKKKIRTVSDNPVIWREARSPVFVKRQYLRIAAVLIVSLISGIAFFMCIFAALVKRADVLQVYTVSLMLFGTVLTVIFSASCIPAEKESRSWPMLLSTTLTDRQILIGKFVGILRKGIFPWSMLLLFIVYTTVIGITHPLTLVFIVLSITTVIVLLSGTGLFFGTLFRKSNTAIVANVIVAATIWLLVPLFLEFTGYGHGDPIAVCYCMNPFHQVVIIMDIANFQNFSSGLEFGWNNDNVGIGTILLATTAITMFYGLVGVHFVRRAKRRLRKNIF